MEKVDSKGLEGEGEHEEISQQYEEQSQLGQMLQQQQQSQLSQLPSQLLSQPPSQQTQPPSQHNDNSTYKAPLPLGAAKLLTPSDHKLYQSFQSHITSTNILRLDNYSTRKKYFPHLPPHLPINHHHTHMHNHF